ncbi:AAA family ATPase [Patescibacteria group bacterium]|nr:AAA family ATPase [Patescibacteria group bacterium]MBU4512407.1 AAA family ATPase [Patescibacteria group bacterium]MCG2693181.1 AAA family ATPase [Candidatus Parcubacteria bacterium]
MYLSKLELSGFKSFAKKTILTFPKLEIGKSNITAIVGPNGSGKSNIADGIRWVTGEQSIKTLRGKKGEDVIFSGTNKLARLGCAEVSLYLTNSDKKISLPDNSKKQINPANYSEMIITRKIYRSGESEYLINKTKARLNDILMLMAELSFGQKSYSVIGQGLADAVLSASPGERKDFLNEAAGIKQYQLKRDQAANKMESTKENLSQAGRLIQEIEPRLRSLSRQVKKLERREEMERELHGLQVTYYSALWQDINTSWLREKKHLYKITAERQETQRKVTSLQERLEGLGKSTINDNQFQKLQQNYYELNNEKNKLLRTQSELQSKLTLQREKSRLQAQTVSSTALSTEETRELLGNLKNIKALQQKLIAGLNSKDTENINDLALRIIKKIGQLIQTIQKNDGDEQSLSTKKQESENYIKKIEKELGELEKEINRQDEEIKKAQSGLNNFNQEHQKGREELVATQKQVQKSQSELNQCITQENEIRVQLARTETKKENLEAEIRQELGSPDKLAHGSIQMINENELREAAKQKIENLKHQLELIGGIDKEIIKEYQETKKRYAFIDSQIDDLKTASESLEKLIKKLEEIIKTRFDASFEKINQEFQKFFKSIFGGGKAKLIFTREVIAQPQLETADIQVDSESARESSSSLEKIRDNPKNTKRNLPSFADQNSATIIKEGVEIEATPPGKKLKSINMLSGGERALTSIALICAIIANNPSPFVILDEVDAALDEANSVRFAEILEQLSHKTQFVMITHNRATMEKARILYGVTMSDSGVSKLLSIKMEEIKIKQ